MQVFSFIALKNVWYAFNNMLILMCGRRAAVSEHTASFVKTFSTAHIWICIFDTESKYSISIFRKYISVHVTLC